MPPQEKTNTAAKRRATQNRLIGVIDIGSNSVRLVVFQGLRRNPQVLFNEKVLCGLGRCVGETGRMDDEAVELAMATLRRFAILCDDMRLDHLDVVATAAVRESENGLAFIERVREECGFTVQVISGKKEARLSALGVISGMPDADGIVGDLGGGSLELIRVAAGKVHNRVTLPIGPLRLMGRGGADGDIHRDTIRDYLLKVDWLTDGKGRGFYMVGGSWRALARLQMARAHTPLQVLQGYVIARDAAEALCRQVAAANMRDLEALNVTTRERLPVLPLSAVILQELMTLLEPGQVIPSSLGLREGLHYNKLNHAVRAQDPFLAACRDLADMTGRFPEHADKLMAWIDPLFRDEDREGKKLRYAACLLSDIGWRGHPDFRAKRAIYEILYGHFVGVGHIGRAFVGLAIYICYGAQPTGKLADICLQTLSPDEAHKAQAVGLALRLGQRISGGTSHPLDHSHLKCRENRLELHLKKKFADLSGQVVEKRHLVLASHLGLDAKLVIDA